MSNREERQRREHELEHDGDVQAERETGSSDSLFDEYDEGETAAEEELYEEQLYDQQLYAGEEYGDEGGFMEGEGRPNKAGGKGPLIALLSVGIAVLLGACGFILFRHFGASGGAQAAQPGAVAQGAQQGQQGAPQPTFTPQPQYAAAPNLLHETMEVAERFLVEQGIEAEIYFIPSKSVPEGLVCLQSVTPGALARMDEPLTLYVSMGPAPTPTPELTPLPTPTPKPTPKPTARPTIPVIVAPPPVETPCPTG